MSKKTSILAYIILIALAILGAWLLGEFEGGQTPKEVSGTDLLLSLFGFFLSLGSLIGIILIIRQNTSPIKRDELIAWGVVRKNGRSSYIQRTVMRGCVFSLIVFSTLAFYEHHQHSLGSKDIMIIVALLLTCVFGSYYAAVRNWSANEDTLTRSKLLTDHSSQDQAK